MTIKKLYIIFFDTYYKLFKHEKVRFIVVGGAGFMVNYSALAIFYKGFHVHILAAQIISAELAVFATFIGNNVWSFTSHNHIPLTRKIIKFHVSAAVGMAINSSCVVSLVLYGHIYYGLALVFGSVAGLIWNYTLYKRFVFKSLRT